MVAFDMAVDGAGVGAEDCRTWVRGETAAVLPNVSPVLLMRSVAVRFFGLFDGAAAFRADAGHITSQIV